MKNTNQFELFYNRIEELRIECGYSKKYVCEQIGITQQTYQNWMNGHTNSYNSKRKPTKPTLESMIELSLLYHKSIDYLMGYTDFTSKENEAISQAIGLSDNSINILRACMGIKDNYVLEMLDKILKSPKSTMILSHMREFINSDDDIKRYIWMGRIIDCMHSLSDTKEG